MKDVRGVVRGNCTSCGDGECDEYAYNVESSRYECLYCGHLPVKHRRIDVEAEVVPEHPMDLGVVVDGVVDGVAVDGAQDMGDNHVPDAQPGPSSKKGVRPKTNFPLGCQKINHVMNYSCIIYFFFIILLIAEL